MPSLYYSAKSIDAPSDLLRRSDRKKTKKIYRDDFLLPSSYKAKHRKHKIISLPCILNSQINENQYYTQQTLATLNYSKNEFSLQMLKQMRRAVNRQQQRLNLSSQIKLIVEKNLQFTKLTEGFAKQHKKRTHKEKDPIIQQISTSGDCGFSNQSCKDYYMNFATVQQLELHSFTVQMQQQIQISVFSEDSELNLINEPKMRKQSSRLLSDNYQSNELFYAIDYMIPYWHRQQNQFDNPQEQFVN